MSNTTATGCWILPTPDACLPLADLLAEALQLSWQVLIAGLFLLLRWWPLAAALLLGLVITVVLMSPAAKARVARQVKPLLLPFFWPSKLLGSVLLLATGLLPFLEPGDLLGEMLLTTLCFHLGWSGWLAWRQPVLRPLVGVLGLSQLFLSLLMMGALQVVLS